MAIVYWCRLGGLAGTFPFRLDLLSLLRCMGQSRGAAQNIRGTGSALGDQGKIDGAECLINGTFSVVKQESQSWKNQAGKGLMLIVIADAAGLPLDLSTQLWLTHMRSPLSRATPAETLNVGQPRRFVGDRTYDSDSLDQKLAKRGVVRSALHRRNRARPATQDGRALCRYRRRWKIERLIDVMSA
jgi:hypothetical protein